jgi:hypothetical protein
MEPLATGCNGGAAFSELVLRDTRNCPANSKLENLSESGPKVCMGVDASFSERCILRPTALNAALKSGS